MRLAFALLSIASIAAGCAGSETGNPFVGDVATDTHSSDPDAVDVLASAGVIVEQAWVVLDPIAFHPAAACEDDSDLVADLAVGAVDHAAAGAVRAAVELPADDYCRLSVNLATAAVPLPATAPAELEGNAVLISGTTALGAPFRIESDALVTFDVRATGADFALDGDTPSLFLGMDVNAWLGDLDLDAATADGDGVIVIDATTNTSFLTAFEDAFPRGVELFRDQNGSGSVDEAGDVLIGRGTSP